MITYRAIINQAHVRDRGMLCPGFTMEGSRDSKRLRAEAERDYHALLATHSTPDHGAYAYLERVDRYGCETLEKHTGKPTKRDPTSGRVLAGEWESEQ